MNRYCEMNYVIYMRTSFDNEPIKDKSPKTLSYEMNAHELSD